MNQSDLDHIVTLVTQQVLAVMEKQASSPTPRTDGLAKILVVGTAGAELPEQLRRAAVLFDLEDYRINRNILRYDRVVITALNITQLADIAQGRIGDEVSCAVLHALLNGIDTFILNNALSFRKFAGKGSTALYQLLEGYAQTLQVFGVKPVGQPLKLAAHKAKPAKYQAPAPQAPRGSALPNCDRLITEAQALALIKQGGHVHLPADVIITPAARDVFAHARVSPVQDG